MWGNYVLWWWEIKRTSNLAPRAILSASFIGNPFLYSYHLSGMKQLAVVTLVPTAMRKVLAAEWMYHVAVPCG